jgi:hypothetical protein
MTTFTTEDRISATALGRTEDFTLSSNNTFSSTAVFQALPEGLDPIPYEEKYKELLRSSS